MGETKSLLIENVEEKNGFFVVKAGGQRYGTKESGIKSFVGKNAVFNVAMVAKGNYKNWYINAPLPEIPTETPNHVVNYDQGKRENTLIMCAKDLVVAGIMSGQIDPKDNDAVAERVLAIYTKMSGGDPNGIPF